MIMSRIVIVILIYRHHKPIHLIQIVLHLLCVQDIIHLVVHVRTEFFPTEFPVAF
jgi:hypothetical protein